MKLDEAEKEEEEERFQAPTSRHISGLLVVTVTVTGKHKESVGSCSLVPGPSPRAFTLK